MTKEDKQLLLRDLCARLPYGVICEYTSIQPGYELYNEIGVLESIQRDYQSYKFVIDGHLCGFSDFKPYLRPMSSMTEEEFVYFMGLRGRMLQSYEIQSMMKEAFNMPNSITIVTQLYDYLHKMDWLLSKHFDVRGLIPKGLAIEAPEGMY